LQSNFDDFLAKPVSYEGLRRCLTAVGGAYLPLPDDQPHPRAETTVVEVAPVPDRLRRRVLDAARIHNATALRSCLRELAALGPVHRCLVDRLRRALKAYDMAAVEDAFGAASLRAPSADADRGAA
jgi:hypothetical protein